MLNSTPSRRSVLTVGLGLGGAALVAGTTTLTASPARADDAPAVDPETQVLVDEDFSDGRLPDGWTPKSGTWEVVDGRLRAIGVDTVSLTIPTPTVPVADFRFEATVQFEEVLNPSRWMHFIAAGTTFTVRSQTTHSAGIEYFGVNRTVTQPAPFDVGVGNDFRSVIEVRGSQLRWTINGTQVLAVDDYVAKSAATWGFNVNDSTVQFDEVKITNLNPQSAARPSAPVFPLLDEGRRRSTITWSAPVRPGTSPEGVPAQVTGYEVSAAAASTPLDAVVWELSTAAGLRHRFSHLPTDEQQVLRVRAVNSLGRSGPAAEVRTVAGTPLVDGRALRIGGGQWPSGHAQAMAVDTERDLVFYSFTDRIVKTDRVGNVLGSITGLGGYGGHLGDITVNPANGKVYGSYYWKHPSLNGSNAFVTTVVDPALMNGLDVSAAQSPAFKIAPVHAVDGLGFGPAFGTSEGEWLLTVPLGHPYNSEYRYLAQYDVSDLDRVSIAFHPAGQLPTGGPASAVTYSVRTGTVNYNAVQNLVYDPWLKRWFIGVYVGKDPQFPNFSLFAVDADAQPTLETYLGTDKQGLVLPLAADGLLHEPTGLRGWYQRTSTGFQPLDNGLYYVCQDIRVNGLQAADVTLYTWQDDPNEPLVPVTPDYGWHPQIRDVDAPAATRHTPYRHDLEVRAYPSATVSLSEGRLPSGLHLDRRAAGTIVGRPARPGTYRFSVSAANDLGTTTEEVSITVE